MKQSYILLVFCTFFMSQSTFSQSDQNAVAFENGLYKTFNDLIDGKVVTKLPYREDVHSSKDGVTRYNVFHEGKYRTVRGIYCYVNKNHIYLNAREYGRKGYYIRSHFTGRYAYFEDRLGKDKFEMRRTAPGMTAPTGAAVTSKIWGIVLDMQSGKVIKTSRWRMKKLLEPYPKLWRKYKKGTKSNKEVFDLIVELNQVAD